MDHLSRLSNEPFQPEKKEIVDYFPDKQLFRVEENESWYANIVNYLVCVRHGCKTLTSSKERDCFMNPDSIGGICLSIQIGARLDIKKTCS